MIGIGPPRSDREWAEYASITGQAFLGDAEESGSWIALARAVGIVRLVREEGRVVAGAAAYLVPQYFGGREVPAGAVADVCVVPERRGSGIARAHGGDRRCHAGPRLRPVGPLADLSSSLGIVQKLLLGLRLQTFV